MKNNEEYNKKVIERFLHPKNFGKLENPDAVGEVGNPKCGDIMKIYLKIDKNTKKIKDIKFQTMGCVAAIAATDAVCDIAKGKQIAKAKKITKKDIMKKLENLPTIKIHCSVLGEEALKKAIENYEKNI